MLVLYRTDVRSLLYSYTKRFDMNYWEEALVMINSLAVLHSQLQLLDRKFVRCVHFESFTGRGADSDSRGSASASDIASRNGTSAQKQQQQEQRIAPYTAEQKASLLAFIHGDVLTPHATAMWAVIKAKGVGAPSNSNGGFGSSSVGDDGSAGFHSNFLLWRLQRQMSLLQAYCSQEKN